MNISFEEIPELSSQTVHFYSVKLGRDPVCEFEKFDAIEFQNPTHLEELQIIYETIEQIRHRGAKGFYFHPEGPAEALPRVSKIMMERNKEDFGIRLYCIHINESSVILLNGGVKTNLDPTLCPNVADHFNRALKIAVRLKRAIKDDLIRFTANGMGADENFEIDI